MSHWHFVAGPATGGHELEITEGRNRRYTTKLDEPSEVSFSLDGRHSQADVLDELETDIHVLWKSHTGTTMAIDRCRVGTTGDTIDADRHTVDVSALDYRAVLNRRTLYSGDTLTWSSTDQAEIAWGLVQQTQANTGGNLGISKGWVGTTPTGVNRDRTYELGDSVGERIQMLSEVINGFEWDVTPTGQSALTLEVFYPQRGVNRGVVLEYGGLVAGVRREVPTADYANAIRYTGADGLTAQEREAADLADLPAGRWDAVHGDTGLTTQTALNDRADWQIAESQSIPHTYTLTLHDGAWDGPDHIWLGDTVQVVVMSGRLSENSLMRVYEMSFVIGGDDQETVEITVGGRRSDFRRRTRATERRLRNLERH